MKIIPMRIDYTADIRTMCEYLLRCELHDPAYIQSEQLIGRFQVGRATGHSTALKTVADSFRKQGLHVLEVYGNREELRARDDDEVIHYSKFSTQNRFLRLGTGVPDLVLFDAASHFIPQLHGVEEGINNFMMYLHRGIKKRTVFFYVQ